MPRKSKRALQYQKAAARLVESNEKRHRDRLMREERGQREEGRKARGRLSKQVKRELNRAKGEILSYGEMRLVLLLYFNLVLKKDVKNGDALTFVSEALGIGESTIRDAREEFVEHGTVRTRDGSKRGPRRGPKAPPGTTLLLKEKGEERNKAGRQVTVTGLQTWLASAPSENESRIPMQVSSRTVRNWLGNLGYHRAKGKPGYTVTQERKTRVREYLIDFTNAYKLDLDDNSPYKIVYMDESYLHVNHRSDFSWFEVDGDHRSTNKKGRGQRIIIVHAITKDGPVIADEWREDGRREGFPKAEGWFAAGDGRRGSKKGKSHSKGSGSGEQNLKDRESQGAGKRGESRVSLSTRDDEGSVQRDDADGDTGQGEPVGPTRIMILGEPTAEMLFPARENNSEDYHDNIDSDVFLTWLKKRLWPTFKQLYGEDKKMIIVLDKAPYRHGMTLYMTKTDSTALLSDLKIGKIRVTRGKKHIEYDVPYQRGAFANAPKGATVAEIRLAAFKTVKENRPQDIFTRPEKRFKDHDAGYMLFTPTYCPYFQPIELFWGDAKIYVASTYPGDDEGRTMQEAATSLRRGRYEGDAVDGRGPKAPVNCKALVRHSITKVNEVIARDEVLNVSVDDGLDNIPPSYKVSRDAGLEALETGDEVELLAVDVEEDQDDLEEDKNSLEAAFNVLERCDEDAKDMGTALATLGEE